jgi:competence protein ComEC
MDVHWQTQWRLPENLEGKTISITGIVASIPEHDQQRTTFLFLFDKLQAENKQIKTKALVHLSWQYPKENIKVGDEWRFRVRLKKIHGMMNPGSFDYEAWSLQEGIRASGYIYHDDAKKISSHWYNYPWQRIREHMYEEIIKVLPQTTTSPWVAALALGIRQGVSADSWQVLRNTGTNHLMAIAGLHIGFMSAFVYALVNRVWRRIPKLVLKCPAQHAGGIAALLVAFGYSALAGFSLPTQRACIMLVIFFIISLLRRNNIAWQAWSLALFSVLFINPLSVLTESFWLSFGSVALIIYGMSARLSPKGLWWRLGRIQWVLTLGLIPLSIWFFHECSFVSFIANSIAIPFVGFLIVPVILLGCLILLISTKIGGFILLFSDKLLAILWKILSYFSHLSWAVWYQGIPHYYFLIFASIAVVILLVPVGFPGRWFGLVCLLPFLLYQPLQPPRGDAWVTMLDVGQGLSTIIQTSQHVLIYDTGARLSENFDMGKNVVLPFLHTIGAKKIDMLVVSHRDNDHSGGANAILKEIAVLNIKTSSLKLFPQSIASYCLQHETWRWDGVDFEFLYPSEDLLDRDNDSSCVLKISTKQHQILLPGDIEKFAEKYLATTIPQSLRSEILIAPHHGSKTSAVSQFIEAINPKIVLFPVGYRNRYHFPNVNVLKLYKELGVSMYDSVTGGAVQIKLSDNPILIPELYRVTHQHYWNF